MLYLLSSIREPLIEATCDNTNTQTNTAQHHQRLILKSLSQLPSFQYHITSHHITRDRSYLLAQIGVHRFKCRQIPSRHLFSRFTTGYGDIKSVAARIIQSFQLHKIGDCTQSTTGHNRERESIRGLRSNGKWLRVRSGGGEEQQTSSHSVVHTCLMTSRMAGVNLASEGVSTIGVSVPS